MISGKGRGIDLKDFLTPSLVTALLVIPLATIDFKAPFVVAEAIRLSGSITTPATMIILGVTLAQVPVKDVFTEWRLYPMMILKMVLVPVIAWLVFRQIVTDSFILSILVVLSAMPTAIIVAMLAIEYDNDERLASKGIFLTTLLSCATIPLVVNILL